MRTRRIFITGFMGAGKSTIGQIMANTLGWEFYDVDREIEKAAGKPVARIFEESGEPAFREMESAMLSGLCGKDLAVISLGGGTITKGTNLSVMQSAGKIIYLKSSPERIYQRLRYKTDRPLFQTVHDTPMSRDEALQKITVMLLEREVYYNRADLIFLTDNQSVGRSVDELLKLIKRMF